MATFGTECQQKWPPLALIANGRWLSLVLTAKLSLKGRITWGQDEGSFGCFLGLYQHFQDWVINKRKECVKCMVLEAGN